MTEFNECFRRLLSKLGLHQPMPAELLADAYISKMYFSHWMPPGMSERMWSVNLDVSISGEYQTLGGHSGRPSE